MQRPNSGKTGPTVRKLIWFVALWAAGVLAVSILAYGIRWLIVP